MDVPLRQIFRGKQLVDTLKLTSNLEVLHEYFLGDLGWSLALYLYTYC
jgi:hypothetical protein